MHYTLNQLQIFRKIADTESITRAAEELHLTQPAVSIQLKNLQNQFEIPLTEVIGRKLYLTDFGREIAAASERILAEVDEIRNRALAWQGELAGKMRISVVSTGKYVMPYFLSEFIQTHKSVDLIMDVTNKSSVVRSLEQNEVDFSLVSVLPDKLQVDRIELMPNQLHLIGKKFPDGKKKKKYTPELMGEIPLIFREPGSATRRAMESYIEQHQIAVPKKLELTSNEAVKQAVLAGLGYSIMPLIGILNELDRGSLQIIPVEDLPLITNWNLIWLKKKKFSPVAHAFLNHLQLEKDRIIQAEFPKLSIE